MRARERSAPTSSSDARFTTKPPSRTRGEEKEGHRRSHPAIGQRRFEVRIHPKVYAAARLRARFALPQIPQWFRGEKRRPESRSPSNVFPSCPSAVRSPRCASSSLWRPFSPRWPSRARTTPRRRPTQGPTLRTCSRTLRQRTRPSRPVRTRRRMSRSMRAPLPTMPRPRLGAASSALARRARPERSIAATALGSVRFERWARGPSCLSQRAARSPVTAAPRTTAPRRRAFGPRPTTRRVVPTFRARSRSGVLQNPTAILPQRSRRSARTLGLSSREPSRSGCAAIPSRCLTAARRRESQRSAREHVQDDEEHDGADDHAAEKREERREIIVHAFSSGSTSRGLSSVKMCARTSSVVARIVGSLAGFGISGLVGVSS